MRTPSLALSVAAIVALCTCSVDSRMVRAKSALQAALPTAVAAQVLARVDGNPTEFLEALDRLSAEVAAEPELLRRVDKKVVLGEGYAPKDLVALDGKGIAVSREGHRLRKAAAEALLAMDRAARAAGVNLVVGSAYRSYQYQVEVYARTVAQEGSEAAADRISARPGRSQHQLGMALDFAPIDETFAQTKASAWLEANAGRFGFSLSFPKGFEPVTGYTWESWHWRFIGKTAVGLQKAYFGDVQQYLVQFWEAYAAPSRS